MNNALGDCVVTYGLINFATPASNMRSNLRFCLSVRCFEHLTHRRRRMSRTTFPGYAQRPSTQGGTE